MADKTIEWIHGIRAQDPNKPWFAYFSTGCAHAPHHVPREWADKYKGKFDQGWDALREETFARQKALGVIPADAELTPRNEAFPAWESLPDDLRKLYARQMEVYAGFQENADWNVGRVLDAIEEMGEVDDTLVFWIWGDNGASMEGTLTGTFNELTIQNGIPLTAVQQRALIAPTAAFTLGHRAAAPHCGAAWPWAANAPFQWGKKVAWHLGGTCNPMVIHWPARINDGWAVWSYFTHSHQDWVDHPRDHWDSGPTQVDGIEQSGRRWGGVLPTPWRTRQPPNDTRSSTSRSWGTVAPTRTVGGSRRDHRASLGPAAGGHSSGSCGGSRTLRRTRPSPHGAGPPSARLLSETGGSRPASTRPRSLSSRSSPGRRPTEGTEPASALGLAAPSNSATAAYGHAGRTSPTTVMSQNVASGMILLWTYNRSYAHPRARPRPPRESARGSSTPAAEQIDSAASRCSLKTAS